MYTAPSIERSGKTTFLPIEHVYDVMAASDRGDLSYKWNSYQQKQGSKTKNKKKHVRRNVATPIENACLMVLSRRF